MEIITGIIVMGIFGGYAAYKKMQVSNEFSRLTEFIEKATFQAVPFQKRTEMGYDIYFYQEDKFSLEIWKKQDTFILYLNDDEMNKPVLRIEKKKEGVQVFHPTIFYYRTLFEQKKKLMQSFVHRYVGDEFMNVPKEEELPALAEQLEEAEELPEGIREKVAEIQKQYQALLEKKDELSIESYTLIETLVFNDLKRILTTFKDLTPESQSKYEKDVLEGLADIQNHLKGIEERMEREQVRELKKSLRVLKERGEE